MKVNPGVDHTKLNPEIRRALLVLDYLYTGIDSNLTLVATYDVYKEPNSKHLINDAVHVLRPPEKTPPLLQDLQVFLGPEFEICFFPDYLHLAYDPSNTHKRYAP